MRRYSKSKVKRMPKGILFIIKTGRGRDLNSSVAYCSPKLKAITATPFQSAERFERVQIRRSDKNTGYPNGYPVFLAEKEQYPSSTQQLRLR
ncbi:MAG: hypothetical protein J6B55_08170, partial [Clostridia bacterium]|nr:hypothetical protein [Clostridia bacterium]